MRATVRIFSMKTFDCQPNEFESLAHARGYAKNVLRKTPFHWEHARVFYSLDGIDRVVIIKKNQGGWVVTDKEV